MKGSGMLQSQCRLCAYECFATIHQYESHVLGSLYFASYGFGSLFMFKFQSHIFGAANQKLHGQRHS